MPKLQQNKVHYHHKLLKI